MCFNILSNSLGLKKYCVCVQVHNLCIYCIDYLRAFLVLLLKTLQVCGICVSERDGEDVNPPAAQYFLQLVCVDGSILTGCH